MRPNRENWTYINFTEAETVDIADCGILTGVGPIGFKRTEVSANGVLAVPGKPGHWFL